jgi:hypothetical protein
MRKILLFILIPIVFSYSCKREKNRIDDIFSEYEGLEGVSIATLPPVLFLTLLQKYGNAPDLSIENLEIVRIMVYNKTSSNNLDTSPIMKEIITELDGLKFEDLLRYSGSGDEGIIKIHDTGVYISDLMFLINNAESLLLIGISGKMETSNIMQLATEIDFKSFKEFRIN